MSESSKKESFPLSIKKLIPNPPRVPNENFNEIETLKENELPHKKKSNRKLHQIVRVLFTTIYLLNIIISIPISFQIGGIDCGLCFTITIFLIYFSLATFKFVFFKSKSLRLYNNWFRIMYYLQLFYIPPLLMICLSLFDKDAGIKEELQSDENVDELNILVLSRTLVFFHNIILNDIWPVYIHVINIWKWLILHSTPYFTLLEGIFVILFIQVVGQFYKAMKQPYSSVFTKTVPLQSRESEKSSLAEKNDILTKSNLEQVDSNPISTEYEQSFGIDLNDEDNSSDDDLRSIASVQDFNFYNDRGGETVYIGKEEEKSSLYNILGLVASSTLITLSIYYLYKIYILPNFTLNAIEATLIGIFFALAVIIGIYGIVSRKGSILESSLLFAYLVRCIYQINPVLSDSAMWDIMEKLNKTWQQQMLALQNNNLNHTIKNFFSSSHHYSPGDNNELGAFINYLLSKLMFYHKSEDRRNFVDLSSVFLMSILPKSIISVYKISTSLIKQSFTPSVVTNLTFRLLVYYSATRIIPTLSKKNSKKITNVIASQSSNETNNHLQLNLQDHTPTLDKEIDELVKDNMSRSSSLQSLQSLVASPTEHSGLSLPLLGETECSNSSSTTKDDAANKIPDLIYVYSPCILIAMYTHLTLQYCKDNNSGTPIDDKLCIWGTECVPNILKVVANKLHIVEIDIFEEEKDGVWVDNWAFWNWVNILFYLVLYFFEMQN